jgi:hypothetical protein
MKSFNSFLLEARRNPKVNIKANPVKALEKYDADNFYATYIKSPDQFDSLSKKDTENMRKDSPQVMLNINNRFNTLHGIYCYEISMMYDLYSPTTPTSEQLFRVPFAGESPFVAILERLPEGKHIDTKKYSKSELKADLKNLKEDVVELMKKKHKDLDEEHEPKTYFDIIASLAEKYSRVKRPAGYLWNTTRLACFLLEKDLDTIEETLGYTELEAKPVLTKYTPKPQMWAKVVRRAPGKKFFLDSVTDPGLGVIHENEPSQAVFISRKYKVREIIQNTDIEYNRKHKSTKFAKKEGELLTHVRRGKDISDIPREKYPDLIRILLKKDKDKNTLLDKKKMTQKLPPIVTKEILDKDLDYYDQLVGVDHKTLMLSLARNISPKEIRDFLLNHPEIKLSQEDLNNLVQRRPQNLSAILHRNPNPQTIIDVIENEPISIQMLYGYIPLESKKQYKIPAAVQRALPKIFDKVFTGETKTKGSAALQDLRDENYIRLLKGRILDLVHTKQLLPEVSNAIVNVLTKNNQLSKAEIIQLNK